MSEVKHSATVYIALGTNLGDRRAHLQSALAALAGVVTIERVSSVYETTPAYVLEQPAFLNAVLRGSTTLPAETVLDALQKIEADLGRITTVRYGPRVIDLDILVYGEEAITNERLVVPHPRLAERPFVLVPLAELAPELVPPGFTQSIATLAERVHGNGDILARVGSLTIPKAQST